MKILVKYKGDRFPAVLQMTIYDAPHRRMHRAVLDDYRKQLYNACFIAGVPVPLDDVTDVELNFVNPSSPDGGGVFLAWESAIDGKAWGKKPTVFTDDSFVGDFVVKRRYNSGMFDQRGQIRKKGAK